MLALPTPDQVARTRLQMINRDVQRNLVEADRMSLTVDEAAAAFRELGAAIRELHRQHPELDELLQWRLRPRWQRALLRLVGRAPSIPMS